MADIKTIPENLWRVVSKGYAAENLVIGQCFLEVYCPELSGFADGEIISTPIDLETKGMDDTGNHYTCKIKTTNSIKTKWRQQGTNRITPPCVRRGERIEVWQYADADQYYWTTSGEDDWLRRLETVTHAYSATRDEKTKEITPDNSYWFQVNTHDKQVVLETSQADGEPFKHAMQIDTKNGNFHYRDSAGNYIQVEAQTNRITVETGGGAKMVLEQENAQWIIPGNLDIKCGNLNIETNKMQASANDIELNANTHTKGDLTNNGKNVGSTHIHSKVKTGGDNTGNPT